MKIFIYGNVYLCFLSVFGLEWEIVFLNINNINEYIIYFRVLEYKKKRFICVIKLCEDC